MIDSFGRPITYLRLSVTELCDLRCRYCMPEEGVCKLRHDQMLTEEEMVRAVQAAAKLGIEKVRITGGEPLTKPNILSICHRVAQVPGIRDVSITTNGIRLPELAGFLTYFDASMTISSTVGTNSGVSRYDSCSGPNGAMPSSSNSKRIRPPFVTRSVEMRTWLRDPPQTRREWL